MIRYAIDPSTGAQGNEWAVILAGGDGIRLRSLTRHIAGDERPKQFCPVLGRGSLLEETRRRAALALAPERTLYVVNRAHEFYYAPLLAGIAPDNIVVQPRNCGTAPAILYSLLRIAARDSKALVVFLPSDHFVSDNQKFMAQVRAAFDSARACPDLVVLLGLEPENPEVEYGWIEPGLPIHGQQNVFAVRRFWEKPSAMLAQALQRRGCLWNSFVMVAAVQALIEIIESAIPEISQFFMRVAPHIGGNRESAAIADLYARLSEANFSHQVLAHQPERLAVFKVTGVRWNDLGEPKRVLASLAMAGVKPRWAEAAVPQFA